MHRPDLDGAGHNEEEIRALQNDSVCHRFASRANAPHKPIQRWRESPKATHSFFSFIGRACRQVYIGRDACVPNIDGVHVSLCGSAISVTKVHGH